MTEKRPNILFIIADDASHFGCYGHSFVNTPNIDRIAKQGIRFDNMFTTNPKCAPSRASILTGHHTWQLKEACTHWCVFPGKDEFDVFPDLLEDSGYHVGLTGKGWAPGDFERKGRTRNPAGPSYNQIKWETPDDTSLSPNDYTANFKAFLDEREGDQPFSFWFGAKEPHRGYNLGQGERNGKHLDEVKDIPPYWPQEDEIRSDMLDYAFEIEWFDTRVGQMLDHLESINELDNTLVIVTSDNGCPFPRVKGQMYDDDFRLPFVAMWGDKLKPRNASALCSFIDIMPTFLDIAGIDIPDALPGKSLCDVFNNDVKPGERKEAFMGRERHDLGREGDLGYPVRCMRDEHYLYVRNYEPDRWPAGNPETGYTNCDSSPTKSRILDMHDQGDSHYWDLAFGKRPAEELYDIQKDPHCLKNLARDKKMASIKDSMAKRLGEVLGETEDPRANGQGDVFDSYEYVNAPHATHSWQAYKEGRWEPQRY